MKDRSIAKRRPGPRTAKRRASAVKCELQHFVQERFLPSHKLKPLCAAASSERQGGKEAPGRSTGTWALLSGPQSQWLIPSGRGCHCAEPVGGTACDEDALPQVSLAAPPETPAQRCGFEIDPVYVIYHVTWQHRCSTATRPNSSSAIASLAPLPETPAQHCGCRVYYVTCYISSSIAHSI